jgi:hypothetical protein
MLHGLRPGEVGGDNGIVHGKPVRKSVPPVSC